MAKTAKKRVLVERQGGVSIETSNQGKNPIIDDRSIAFAVYILYFLGYVTGITTLIGVMIAYLQNRSCSSVRSHFTFQVRMFLIGLLSLFVGGILLYIGIGVLVLLGGLLWSLIRNVKSILALNRNEPIINPDSWIFGD